MTDERRFSKNLWVTIITAVAVVTVLVVALTYMYKAGRDNNMKDRVSVEKCVKNGGSWIENNCIQLQRSK